MVVLGMASRPPEEETLRPRRRGSRADALLTFAGHFTVGLGLWAVIALLAREGAREAVGQYALALAVTSPASQWANLQLRMLLATDARNEVAARDAWRVAVGANLGAIAVTCALASLVGWGPWWLIAASSVAKAIDNFAELVDGHMQRRLEFRASAAGKVVRATCLVGGTAAVLAQGMGLAGVAGVLVLASLAGFVVNGGFARRWRGAAGERTYVGLSALLRRAVPLGAVLFLVSLQQNIPRYIVEGELGVDALGLFTAVNYFTVAASLLVQAVSQAAFPRIADDLAKAEVGRARRRLVRLLLAVVAIAALGVAGSWALGDVLLAVLYGPAFRDGAGLFVGLMGAAAFNFIASVFRHLLTTLGRVRGQTLLLLASSAVAAGGGYLGVMWAGLSGMVLTLLLLAVAHGVVLGALALRAWRHAVRG